MSKRILGLDLGTNSIGWALLDSQNGTPNKIIALGSRIFNKAVEEKTPTPKNVKRRDARLARRVIQRRARRKLRMLNYLVKLNLLPKELQNNTQPEKLLNELGNPYELRAKALDGKLTQHELGRVILHLVQRRGFLSNRKTLLGDMVDDPDVQSVLNDLEGEEDNSSESAKEETAFKKDISELREKINNANCRTLGEYLATFNHHDCKRNRSREEGNLRTDRQMYKDELDQIWQEQCKHHSLLTDDIREQIEEIIFYQRPLKLKSDRIGKCSLEPNNKRANIARLECQRFRYLQDINNLDYFDFYKEKWIRINNKDREKLATLFEDKPLITFPAIRKKLGLDKGIEFNLETGNKKLKGNITACKIRKVLSNWDKLPEKKQIELVEDLLTIRKKSVLKKRLINHWKLDALIAAGLCLLEFEPGHSNLSVRAINRLLPYLEQGQIYSDARISAGYGYEQEENETVGFLGSPPEITNPIVQKGLHELRRLVNAIIAEHGKPDVIRIEMARDLEMNTKRYKQYIKQQKANTESNDEAVEKYKMMGQKNLHLQLSSYPSRNDKIKYRLWKDQNQCCIYSGKTISLSTLFSAAIDTDHILPYSQSLDDSYMNKVVCYADENKFKGQRTPIDAFGSTDKWEQITQRLNALDKKMKSKKNRFYMTSDEVMERDFINSQLNDTRYICRVAQSYLKTLGSDITVSKGIITSWLRYHWDLNSLIGTTSEKERIDHRHHTIDALVTACVDRGFYQTLVRIAGELEKTHPELNMRDIHTDPPWQSFRDDAGKGIENIIVAHTPQRKINDALHEETGVGFIDGVGTVYRINLDSDFKITRVKDIIDETVRKLVCQHLEKYDNKPKEAFANDVNVFHKDGKTPIKRVRVVQSKTTLPKLEESKFGAKNKKGEVFKWLAYGNIHHVEIIKDKKTGKYKSDFITMMEASHRAKGINMKKQPIIKTNHGDDYGFIMALHINDLVSVEKDGFQRYFRIQKLGRPYSLTLRLNTASTLNNKDEEIQKSISTLMTEFKLQKHQVNAIGKII